ncbi:hypothetical protein MKX57_16265 [Lysinibacillus sp. FSL M8-0216]|uniref:hypothetical protein n=1 Tax=unclassified Lysinibacillus TaxID=2636778 RepID=UPI00315A6E2B
MGMQSGFYNVVQEGVYVSEFNEIVWEYKVIKKDFEEHLFLMARDFISERRVPDYPINSIEDVREALEFLSNR